jgi:hypothetical protein
MPTLAGRDNSRGLPDEARRRRKGGLAHEDRGAQRRRSSDGEPPEALTERSEGWCGRGDSNPHGIATASPSSWCVCQFRHFRVVRRERPVYPMKIKVCRGVSALAARAPMARPRTPWTNRGRMTARSDVPAPREGVELRHLALQPVERRRQTARGYRDVGRGDRLPFGRNRAFNCSCSQRSSAVLTVSG